MKSILQQLEAGATVVTATQRLSRYWRDHFNRWQIDQGREVWPTPDVIPWSAWVVRSWRLRYDAGDSRVVLEEHQARALWARVIAEYAATMPPGSGLWHAHASADRAFRAWRLLCDWQLTSADIGSGLSVDCRAFKAWTDRFAVESRAQGWVDQASVLIELPELIHSGAVALPGVIRFAGFDELTPVHDALLLALHAAGVDAAVIDAPAHSAVARRIGFADTDQELAAVAAWSRGQVERGVGGPIGIIVPNLERLRARVTRHMEDALAPGASIEFGPAQQFGFELSLGVKLAQTPLVAAALDFLQCAEPRSAVALLSRVLRSPFARGANIERAARAAIDVRLRNYGDDTAALGAVRVLAQGSAARPCELLGASIERALALYPPGGERRVLTQWVPWIMDWLEAWGWPGDRELDSREYQTVDAWWGLLADFAATGLVYGAVPLREALATLSRMAAERIFQPQSSAAPVQVMGLLEAAGMEFDALWITGLNDATWPPPPRPNPFLPIVLQRHHGMPHADTERELQRAEQVTHRLLASGRDVVVSFAAHDGEQEVRGSALTRHLPSLAEPPTPVVTYKSAIHRTRLPLEVVADPTGRGLSPQVMTHGGAELLRDQSACPFLAYARHRLLARDINTPGLGLTAQDRGTLVHDSLAEFWRVVRTQRRLIKLSAEQRAATIAAAARRALAGWSRRRGHGLHERYLDLEQRRLCGLMGAWLDYEQQREPFSVVAVETKHSVCLGGLTLNVRVDRVDRNADDSLFLIDYKTGKIDPKTSHWMGSRPDEPQLPLYRYAFETDPDEEKKVGALAFAIVRADEQRVVGLAATPDCAPGLASAGAGGVAGWIEVGDEWNQALEALGADFERGAAQVDPKSTDDCRRCEMRPLCRIDELASVARAGQVDADE